MTEEIKISNNQRKVLAELGEYYDSEECCRPFSSISKATGLEVRLVRLACRALARKGYTELMRGLVDDDGMIAGSAYMATRKGAQITNGCVEKGCSRLSIMTTGQCQECWENRKCAKCEKPYKNHELKNGHMVEFEESLALQSKGDGI